MALFSQIPPHNQMEILKKLDFSDFVQFKWCSKETYEFTKNFKHRLHLKAEHVNFNKHGVSMQMRPHRSYFKIDSLPDEPVHLEAKRICIFSAKSNEILLQDFFRKLRIKSETLIVYVEEQEVDPATIASFIARFQVNKLTITAYPSSVLQQPEIKKLKEICLCDMRIEESDFLLLETVKTTLDITYITLSAVNKFFKQWLEGKRSIKELHIEPFYSQHIEMLLDLDFSVCYSPEMAPIEIHESCMLEHVYFLTRMDGKWLFIAIGCAENDEAPSERKLIAGEYDNEDFESWIRSISSSSKI